LHEADAGKRLVLESICVLLIKDVQLFLALGFVLLHLLRNRELLTIPVPLKLLACLDAVNAPDDTSSVLSSLDSFFENTKTFFVSLGKITELSFSFFSTQELVCFGFSGERVLTWLVVASFAQDFS